LKHRPLLEAVQVLNQESKVFLPVNLMLAGLPF
jgi:hypothetical protein